MKPSLAILPTVLLLLAPLGAQRSTDWFLEHRPANCGGALAKATIAARPQQFSAKSTGGLWFVANLGFDVVELGSTGTVVRTLTLGGAVQRVLDVAATPAGNVWISLGAPSELRLVSATGAPLATFSATVCGQNPFDLETNASGDVWINNTAEIRRINQAGAVLFTRALQNIRSIAVTPLGEVFASEDVPSRLAKLSTTGVVLFQNPITGVNGTIECDPSGNVAMAMGSPNEARLYANNGSLLRTFAHTEFVSDVACTSSGDIITGTRSAVRRFNPSGVLLCSVTQALGNPKLAAGASDGSFWILHQDAPPAVTLSAVAPSTLVQGGPDQLITLSGTGFLADSIVLWRSGLGLPMTFLGTTSLRATVGSALLGTAGTFTVEVLNPVNEAGPSRFSEQRNVIVGRTGSFTPYGLGCPGSNGLAPQLSGTGTPRVGALFTQTVTNARANSPVALVLGVSNTSWLGQPLPRSLADLGAPQCRVLASLDVVLGFASNSLGTANVSIVMPSGSALVGAHVFEQAIVIDAGANALGLSFTNAGDAQLGSL